MTDQKRKFAMCSALCSTVYLLDCCPSPLSDLLKGFATGLAVSLLLLALLPQETLARLEKLKLWNHGK